MNKEPRNIDVGLADRLSDKTVPLEERISIARSLVKVGEELSVPLAKNGAADGTLFSDKDLSDDDLMRITKELGFEADAYETISEYEWRTPSTLYPELVLQVVEGPIDIGGATELFPSGQAWNKYDYVNTFNILVSSVTAE
jgi:hypothetical protein